MHHARLYVAESLNAAKLPSEVMLQNADVEHFIVETFGVGESRRLSQRAHIRAVGSEGRHFLVHFSTITLEAQNALLKLFEEPPDGVVFHVVVRNEQLLIPTLRSRLFREHEISVSSEHDVFKAFAAASYGERLEEIATRTKQKDTAWIEDLLVGAEHTLHGATRTSDVQALKSLLLVREYIGTRGASSKMLLEEIALALPTPQV